MNNDQRWEWVIDTAAEATGIEPHFITSGWKNRRYTNVRHAIWYFLRNQGLTAITICRIFHHNYTTVNNGAKIAASKMLPLHRTVIAALEAEYAKRLAEPEPAPIDEEAEPPLLTMAPSKKVYRLEFCTYPEPHYLVRPAIRGREWASRRIALKDGRDLAPFFGPRPPKLGEVVHVQDLPAPSVLGGGHALVPASHTAWEYAGGQANKGKEQRV